jgi:hypothetical protein
MIKRMCYLARHTPFYPAENLPRTCATMQRRFRDFGRDAFCVAAHLYACGSIKDLEGANEMEIDSSLRQLKPPCIAS